MPTPSSQFHSQVLLLPAIFLLFILAVAAEEQHMPMPRPGCIDMCGNISIPFPFGVGRGCFLDGFEVLCDHSFNPPRAFLADKRTNKYMGHGYNSYSDTRWSSPSPLELVSISVGTGEARAYASVSYDCSTNRSQGFSFADQIMNFSGTPFAVSTTHNVLIGVGWGVNAYYQVSASDSEFSCRGELIDNRTTMYSAVRNGSCTGRGCCEATFPANDFPGKTFNVYVIGDRSNEEWETFPCIYGMLVEKSWYNFSTPDMRGKKTLLKRFPRGVQLVLDFIAGNTSCPAEGKSPPQDYACISGNSSCTNATNTRTPGYICKCQDNYDGNPYVPNGCQDIDECNHPEVYPCTSGGICKNKLEGYDCPCQFGMKGDGKAGTCTPIFTAAGKATVGAIVGILVMSTVLFHVIRHKEKKKTEEFFKKNGGPTLEKANVIKLFKEEELKLILKNSNLIGNGRFGEVYKGHLDNKLVAIKKPINGTVLENEQFANEVIIQSQVIHKNIVRLIGCCLEVDAPMLVYEFISHGSLHDCLHNNSNKMALNLDARLSIVAQAADGLAYMHSKANIRILHGDVKPENILLDENFVPKISDFGISRLLARDKEHTASVIGDKNYMDPVYLQVGLLTEKSDVYSFGVVILELISSRKAIHSQNNSLVKCFLDAHKKQKKATEFFDKEIAIAEDLELIDSLAAIAVECLSLDIDQRPTMTEVAQRLHILSQSRKLQDVYQ